MYTIERKSDLSGSFLIVRVPEGEVDLKALRTIQADPPPFLVPFVYRSVDGNAEFTYQLGTLNEIGYFGGSCSPHDYIAILLSVLEPLLDCDDWFMNPFSFVLQPEYVYFNKAESSARYVYIPAKKLSSDAAALKNMLAALVRQYTTSDKELEVRVRDEIFGSNLAAFADMLKKRRAGLSMAPAKPGAPAGNAPAEAFPAPVPPAPKKEPAQNLKPALEIAPEPPVRKSRAEDVDMGDIVISVGRGKKARPEPVKAGPGKDAGAEKAKGFGLFGKRKKDAPQEGAIRQGAVAEIPAAAEPARQGYDAYAAAQYIPVPDDATEILAEDYAGQAKLRLVGDMSLPPVILLPAEDGAVLKIGREDPVIKSDFMFPRETKAVSRPHAVIKRVGGTYHIQDLSSKAGTYINGRRIPPGAEFPLNSQDKISFGNAGADYIIDC